MVIMCRFSLYIIGKQMADNNNKIKTPKGTKNLTKKEKRKQKRKDEGKFNQSEDRGKRKAYIAPTRKP
jgi:hypothetical protein